MSMHVQVNVTVGNTAVILPFTGQNITGGT